MSHHDEIYDEIKSYTVKDLNEINIGDNVRFNESGLDSLDLFEIMNHLEEVYNISFGLDDIPETFSELSDIIEKNMEKNHVECDKGKETDS